MDISQEGHVLDEVSDIGVISSSVNSGFIVKKGEFSDLGVLDPRTTGREMLREGTDMILSQDTDVFDVGIEEVREREIDESISS
jgi:uncharacterized membrane-anchored protein